MTVSEITKIRVFFAFYNWKFYRIDETLNQIGSIVLNFDFRVVRRDFLKCIPKIIQKYAEISEAHRELPHIENLLPPIKSGFFVKIFYESMSVCNLGIESYWKIIFKTRRSKTETILDFRDLSLQQNPWSETVCEWKNVGRYMYFEQFSWRFSNSNFFRP